MLNSKGSGREKLKSPRDFDRALRRETLFSVFFTDPSTGEDLASEQPPEYLLRDEHLRKGYEFLKTHGNAFDLELIFSPHRANVPADLGPKGIYEKKIRTSDVSLFEGWGWRQELKDELQLISAGVADVEEKPLARNFASKPFVARQVRAIKGTGVAVGFFDIEKKNNALGMRFQLFEHADTFKRTLARLVLAAGMGGKNINQRVIRAVKEMVSFEAVREWYMVCEAGAQIAEFVEASALLKEKLDAHTLKVTMPVGVMHGDLSRKFKAVGVNTAAWSPTDVDVTKTPLARWLAKGSVSKAELAREAPKFGQEY